MRAVLSVGTSRKPDSLIHEQDDTSFHSFIYSRIHRHAALRHSVAIEAPIFQLRLGREIATPRANGTCVESIVNFVTMAPLRSLFTVLLTLGAASAFTPAKPAAKVTSRYGDFLTTLRDSQQSSLVLLNGGGSTYLAS